jgi:hypothetical protein
LARNAVSIGLLVALGLLLGVTSHRAVSDMLFQTRVRETLQESLKSYPGAYLSEVRFDKPSNEVIVRAVVRSPRHFSSNDVADLEKKMPQAPDGKAVSLRVRWVAVEVMTSSGPAFDSGARPPADER